MDNEIKELLVKILKTQTAMQLEQRSMQLEQKLMQQDLNKNSLILEQLQSNLKSLAEVQASHYEQNQRQHKEIFELLSDRMSIVERTVKIKNMKAVR